MRILLVEDDVDMIRTAGEYLRRSGFAVDEAMDGATALRMMREHEYDVVVLDVRLPDTTGFDVCREVRSNRAETRVLMATAHDSVEDRVRGLDLGADDYLVKPYALAELAARIRALLRRPAAVLGNVLVVGDLELDTQTRVARRGERTFSLTTKEFILLELLMRRAEHVVSRDAISAHVWDDNHESLSNVIEVFVSRLRRKIDGKDEVPLLTTVRGAGYRLTASRLNAARAK